jgi:hypothetical protein
MIPIIVNFKKNQKLMAIFVEISVEYKKKEYDYMNMIIFIITKSIIYIKLRIAFVEKNCFYYHIPNIVNSTKISTGIAITHCI